MTGSPVNPVENRSMGGHVPTCCHHEVYRCVYDCVNERSSTEESGVVCLKVECAVNDIACLTNLTKSVQWQHISLSSIDNIVRPLPIVDLQTSGPTGQPAIADLYPTSFDIVAGNDAQLFDVVDRTSHDVSPDSSSPSPDTRAAATGKCNLISWPATMCELVIVIVVVVVVTFFNNNFVNCKAISNYGYQKYTK